MGIRSAPEGVRISLIGGFSVSAGPYPIDDAAWRLRKARSIIKLLTLAPSHRLHREQVISALWPELAPEPALNNLHQTLHIARRALSLALAARERHTTLRMG
jgi:DNA-binding SARP family transcriptional activator